MSDWDNKKELSLRTRIGLRLVLLALKIVEPYNFGHQFEEEYKNLNELINESSKPKKP